MLILNSQVLDFLYLIYRFTVILSWGQFSIFWFFSNKLGASWARLVAVSSVFMLRPKAVNGCALFPMADVFSLIIF